MSQYFSSPFSFLLLEYKTVLYVYSPSSLIPRSSSIALLPDNAPLSNHRPPSYCSPFFPLLQYRTVLYVNSPPSLGPPSLYIALPPPPYCYDIEYFCMFTPLPQSDHMPYPLLSLLLSSVTIYNYFVCLIPFLTRTTVHMRCSPS